MDENNMTAGEMLREAQKVACEVMRKARCQTKMAKCDVCGREYPDEGSLKLVKDWEKRHPGSKVPCPILGCRGNLEITGGAK